MPPPDALLVMAKNCPHCHSVQRVLNAMAETQELGQLTVVDIGENPAEAEAMGIRSVPWFRIGRFEFQGLYTRQELSEWASKAATPEGLADYFEHLLVSGDLAKVELMAGQDVESIQALLSLLARPQPELQIRLGIAAVMEAYEGNPMLASIVDDLGRLTTNDNKQIRSDACYFLSLTGRKSALHFVEALLADHESEVVAVAQEGREKLLAESDDASD